MEVKKSPKAELEPKRPTWLLLGYVMVLAFMFVAFEWSKRDIKIDTSQMVQDIEFEEDIMPITEQLDTPPPPPPPAEVPQEVPEILNIVDDDEDVADVEIKSSEDTGEKVEIKEFVAPPVIKEVEPVEEEIFMVVEQMPEFPGGAAALMKHLSQNIKYPTIAQENGIQGRVIIEFVVNRDGSIVDPRVVRGVDPSLDKEAIRVINAMPKWTPGKQGGKTVRVKYTLPVMFRLK